MRPISSHLDRTSFLVNNSLLLTKPEGCTGEYWPKVVAVWTVQKRQRANYSSVQLELARLVPSTLLYGTSSGHVCFEFAGFRKQKNTQLMIVSTETVHMAKSWPGKNQSEHLDLPCYIIKDYIIWGIFFLRLAVGMIAYLARAGSQSQHRI